MNEALETRLSQIEAHLAHVERQNDELNSVIIEQGRVIARLQIQIRRISESVESTELDRIRATNPKPPHS